MPDCRLEPRRKLRIGVIGAGEFAEACHIPGLQSHPLAEIRALCGRRYDRVRAMADRFGIGDVHTDYQELCDRDDLDAVTIVTPNACHAEQAMSALRAGKHVLCEKPLAMNVAEAEATLCEAQRSGKIHQVAFTFRYLFGVQELRRRVRQGDIGTPYYLQIHKVGWQDKYARADGGILHEVGSHLFDLARFILGPIMATTGFVHRLSRRHVDSWTGRITNDETDDMASAWFLHECGMRGQWFISQVTPPFAKTGYVEVIGTEGALRASLSRGTVDVLQASRRPTAEWEALPLPPGAQDGKAHALGAMMQSFVVASLCGSLDGDVDASFHDGVATQQALAAVMEAQDRETWMKVEQARELTKPSPRPSAIYPTTTGNVQ